MEDRQFQQLMQLIQAVDAKVSAIAAYVAAMPGAALVERDDVEALLREREHEWSPQNRLSVPSQMEMASTVINAIQKAAASRAKDGDETPQS